ncbi:MAG: nitroreductase family protein [Planctomycetota bacterium]
MSLICDCSLLASVPSVNQDCESATTLREIIHARRTEKVLVRPDAGQTLSPERLEHYQSLIHQSLIDAGMAPFHFPRGVDDIAEPWRAYSLMQPDARALSLVLREEMAITSKEPQLLDGCGAVVLMTWLPESAADGSDAPHLAAKLRRRDEEHLAATSAMVQNFLLLCTAHGLGNYWSSGGVLGGPDVFKHLSIPTSERLIGAIFIDVPEAADQPAERKPGAHRNNRCDRWIRWSLS